MSKLNCWKIKKCGKEPGGDNVQNTGVCPASTEESCDGINNGKNAGRICWAVAGTFCGGKAQGDFAQKAVSCMGCEVFKQIKKEEGIDAFILLKPGQVYKASKW
jgi:hypothetical protein